MDRLTKWFLEQKAIIIFLSTLVGVPFFIWLYSVSYQLDKKRGIDQSAIKRIVARLAVIYPVGYFFFFIDYFFNLSGQFSDANPDHILPFHLAAMGCGLILMILAANSYHEYEKSKGHKLQDPTWVFFMFWFYILGIWVLQPKLNKYIKA